MDQRTGRNPFDAAPQESDDHPTTRMRWTDRVPGGLKTIIIGTALILIALVVFAVRPSQNTRPNRNAQAGANQSTPVGVAKVTLGDVDVTLNALGTVTPLATVTVKPQVSG